VLQRSRLSRIHIRQALQPDFLRLGGGSSGRGAMRGIDIDRART
jgi:hypothetical protein